MRLAANQFLAQNSGNLNPSLVNAAIGNIEDQNILYVLYYRVYAFIS